MYDISSETFKKAYFIRFLYVFVIYEEISRAGILKSIRVSEDVMYILNGKTFASLDFLKKELGVRCTVKGNDVPSGDTGRGGIYSIYTVNGFRKEKVWAGLFCPFTARVK